MESPILGQLLAKLLERPVLRPLCPLQAGPDPVPLPQELLPEGCRQLSSPDRGCRLGAKAAAGRDETASAHHGALSREDIPALPQP